MTAGWLVAARRRLAAARVLVPSPVLPPRAARVVAIALLTFGGFAMASLAVWPRGGETIAWTESTWQQSTWLTMSLGWPALGFFLLSYVQGVGPAIAIPFTAYLAVMGIQGFHRVRVVMPAIMLTMVYLDQRKLRWPPRNLVLAFIALAVVFVPMKQIGRSIQAGTSGREIFADSRESVQTALSGDSEFQFLDMLAATITLTDDRGSYFLGGTFTGLLTLPVPRPWWPDKPGLADYVFDLSTPQRPMGQTGMVDHLRRRVLHQFWALGVAVVPFCLAYLLGLWHRRAYAAGYGTRTHFAYVLAACSLIQVYRDGLLSFAIFVGVYSMPLVALALLSGRLGNPAPSARASTLRFGSTARVPASPAMKALEIWMNAPSPYQADVFRSTRDRHACHPSPRDVCESNARGKARTGLGRFHRRLPVRLPALALGSCCGSAPPEPDAGSPSPRQRDLGRAQLLLGADRALPPPTAGLPVLRGAIAPRSLRARPAVRLGAREALRAVLRPLLRSRVSGAFAAGAAAAAHLQAAGVRPHTILPFGYFRNPPTPGPGEQGGPAAGAELLYVGQLIPRKGLDLLLRALAAVGREHADLSLGTRRRGASQAGARGPRRRPRYQ